MIRKECDICHKRKTESSFPKWKRKDEKIVCYTCHKKLKKGIKIDSEQLQREINIKNNQPKQQTHEETLEDVLKNYDLTEEKARAALTEDGHSIDYNKIMGLHWKGEPSLMRHICKRDNKKRGSRHKTKL